MSVSCTSEDLPQLFNQLPLMPFTACAAFCSSFPVEKDSAFWGFSAFMCVMISILVLATFIDYLKDAMKNEHSPPPQPNLIMKMLLTFSLWTNAGVLLSVKEQKPGFIKCLDCIRFLSMLWVVTGHTFTFVIPPGRMFVSKYLLKHLLFQIHYSLCHTSPITSGITSYSTHLSPLTLSSCCLESSLLTYSSSKSINHLKSKAHLLGSYSTCIDISG